MGKDIFRLTEDAKTELADNLSSIVVSMEKICEQNELQPTKLNLVVKATKIGLWDMEVVKDDPVNPENTFNWSPEFRSMLGFTDENDFPNKLRSWSDRLHPDDKKRTLEALETHLLDTTGKTPYDIEYRLLNKDAEYIYFRAFGETIRDENGQAVRVAGALLDIMETKKVLLSNELQLAKLNLAVKATKIGLWDMEIVKDDPVNPENNFNWSHEFRNMLGFTDENDFPNKLRSWSDRLHPEDKKRTLDAFEMHLLDATGETPFDIEYRLLRKDGEYAYFRASGETIRDEKGNPISVAGALLDITDVKNIIIGAEKQCVAAYAANKAKSDFLRTMSHEIRTPMNAILGITEIQLHKETLDQEVKKALEMIYASGDLLLGIINDMLDLSKIEADKLDLQIDEYEIAGMIVDAAQLNILRIGSKPIEFELHVEENMPARVSGDELRVKQIINNLLSNAFKYTEVGKVRLSVSSEASKNNDNEVILVFVVNDTGQGMTQEHVNKLFDEYTRFNHNTNRVTEGTGLGMSITQNLVRLMNGEIFVESRLGEGSEFTVRLPQGKSGPDMLDREMIENMRQFRARSRTQMKRVQLSREPMPYGTVLIVDDVETNMYVAKGLLVPYKLNVDMSSNGFDVIEKIRSGKEYDLILMDYMMPNMDGLETTKILREMGYKLPIVVLTADAVAGQADKLLENGFNDFIPKPIDIRQLDFVLNRLIRDKQPPEVIEAARRQAWDKKEVPDVMYPSINPIFAEIFARDAGKAVAVMENILKNCLGEDDLHSYAIHFHGMKSALANINREELSAIAFKLEKSARDGNIKVLTSETPAFINLLRSLVEEITLAEDVGETIGKEEENKPYLCEKLLAIKSACEEYNEVIAEKALSELKNITWSTTTKKLLNTISEHLLHSDFDDVADAISGFLKDTRH